MPLHSFAHVAARTAFLLVNRALNPAGVLLSKPGVIHGSPAFAGAPIWSRRLWDLQTAFELVEEVEGAFVESGVHWGYGVLAMLHATRRQPRQIFGFDSFAGHSPATLADRRGGRFIGLGSSFATKPQDVWRTLELGTGLSGAELDERVTLVPGWMHQTMPTFARSAPAIALVHVDPDFYEPVKATIENLWPALAPGGIMVVGRTDNPELAGKAQAVAEFMEATPSCERVALRMMATDGVGGECTILRKPKHVSSLRAA